jgi:hypothetical protein
LTIVVVVVEKLGIEWNGTTIRRYSMVNARPESIYIEELTLVSVIHISSTSGLVCCCLCPKVLIHFAITLIETYTLPSHFQLQDT